MTGAAMAAAAVSNATSPPPPPSNDIVVTMTPSTYTANINSAGGTVPQFGANASYPGGAQNAYTWEYQRLSGNTKLFISSVVPPTVSVGPKIIIGWNNVLVGEIVEATFRAIADNETYSSGIGLFVVRLTRTN